MSGNKRTSVIEDDDCEEVPHTVDAQPKVVESDPGDKFPIVDELIEKFDEVEKVHQDPINFLHANETPLKEKEPVKETLQ
ncbi:hypothetical protein KY290_017517 [Solanum tuberosum]|uniref:Uncharacterized protein n=1 Tax=Solanum tuberosum TaxID=4113 RepID=A0ABQ7VBH9_SOLTU|nr:hypothetical protein KY290_017517 [Solanum tuberosum]